MIRDEIPRAEAEPPSPRLKPANDSGSDAAAAIDPRILVIARAIGRQIAREHLEALRAANDNEPAEEQ